MATLARGINLGATETVTNTKLHNLVDLASITGILNADCDNSMALANSKLANLIDSGKVSGSAMFNLASIPSGAGTIPVEFLQALMPVGTVYSNAAVATNPATLFGFGTWVAIEGQCVVGLVAGAEFDTLGVVSEGETTHVLTEAEMAAHTHGGVLVSGATSGDGAGEPFAAVGTSSSTGSDTAHNNIQPSYVCYVWRRTV